ncbi:MAG: hypothetical protein ACOZF0_23450 [Thermodesulfobacteriota bacterium]
MNQYRHAGRIWKLSGIMVAILAAAFIGCIGRNQVLKYESTVNRSENIVPGIEPEESDRKILILVRGKGIEPEKGTPMQKKFLAERAAVLDGYRKLAERLGGLVLNAQTYGGSNALSMDEVMVETRAFMRGAQIGAVTYHEGFATVDVKVYITPRQAMFFDQKKYL